MNKNERSPRLQKRHAAAILAVLIFWVLILAIFARVMAEYHSGSSAGARLESHAFAAPRASER